jgi:hypothetical protein
MDAAPAIRLSDLELFADCTKAELRQIESLTTYLQVEQDRVLIREGSPAKEFIIIGSGRARISRPGLPTWAAANSSARWSCWTKRHGRPRQRRPPI